MKFIIVFGSFWLVPDPDQDPEFTSGRSRSRIRNKSFGSATLLQTNEQDRKKGKNVFVLSSEQSLSLPSTRC
jgi:hypothetical protein